MIAALPIEVVRDRLRSAGLVVADLDAAAGIAFVHVGSAESPDGFAGLEPCGRQGLLRSLWVDPARRGHGIGTDLVRRVEASARARGLVGVWLLTEVARAFFERCGYRAVARSDVPPEVRATREFTSLCPDVATVMTRALWAAA
jgi:amino-acid N-acetyltransferase